MEVAVLASIWPQRGREECMIEAIASGPGSSLSPDEASVRAALIGVTKAFGGTLAIADVSIELRAGEVLALLGENGAGKSTCVKLLAGVHQPDLGAILVDGQPQHFTTPLSAQAAGIAVMHQHPGLFPDLSVAENLFIGHVASGTPRMTIDYAGREREAQRLLKLVGLDCAPDTQLSTLRTSEQQLVEIARALSLDAKVLIMDEPTAALSQREVERLFKVVDELRRQGVAMMFVGHRMDEVFRVADRITVLRDGRLIGTAKANELSRSKAIEMMAGREISSLYPERNNVHGDTVLRVTGLSRTGAFNDISFALKAGEILGFGGLVGSGRTEIARVLFGIDQPSAGTIELAGRPTSFASAKDAMASGIAYVSEDRMGQSLVMDFPFSPMRP